VEGVPSKTVFFPSPLNCLESRPCINKTILLLKVLTQIPSPAARAKSRLAPTPESFTSANFFVKARSRTNVTHSNALVLLFFTAVKFCMHVRRVAFRQLTHRCQLYRQTPLRCHSTSSPSFEKPTRPPQPYTYEKPTSRQSWLTRQVKKSPWGTKLFLGLSTMLGYGSVKQIAARRTHAIYEQICSSKAEEDRTFWQDSEFSEFLSLPFAKLFLESFCASLKDESNFR
jgi:hypothetical protein